MSHGSEGTREMMDNESMADLKFHRVNKVKEICTKNTMSYEVNGQNMG